MEEWRTRNGRIGQIHPDESVLCAAGVRNIRSTQPISLSLSFPLSFSASFEAE